MNGGSKENSLVCTSEEEPEKLDVVASSSPSSSLPTELCDPTSGGGVLSLSLSLLLYTHTHACT